MLFLIGFTDSFFSDNSFFYSFIFNSIIIAFNIKINLEYNYLTYKKINIMETFFCLTFTDVYLFFSDRMFYVFSLLS